MSIRFLSLTLSLMIMTGLSACKPKTAEDHSEHNAATENHSEHNAATDDNSKMDHEQADHGQSSTIVKKAGTTQVTFDITPMAAHHKMMESMNMPMNHSNNTSHYVMVTLMDENKQLLKDIPIKIKAIGPDGKNLGDEAGLPMETMSGDGMFHYGHGFDFKTPGKYQILVMFKQGDQVLSTGIEWELN